jgi:hypothetical protein
MFRSGSTTSEDSPDEAVPDDALTRMSSASSSRPCCTFISASSSGVTPAAEDNPSVLVMIRLSPSGAANGIAGGSADAGSAGRLPRTAMAATIAACTERFHCGRLMDLASLRGCLVEPTLATDTFQSAFTAQATGRRRNERIAA